MTKEEALKPEQEFVCSTGLCYYKAQRTWVGLTDEEIDRTLAQTLDAFAKTERSMSDWRDVNPDIARNSKLRRMFARSVEAKLKQKNGYAEEKNT